MKTEYECSNIHTSLEVSGYIGCVFTYALRMHVFGA